MIFQTTQMIYIDNGLTGFSNVQGIIKFKGFEYQMFFDDGVHSGLKHVHAVQPQRHASWQHLYRFLLATSNHLPTLDTVDKVANKYSAAILPIHGARQEKEGNEAWRQ